MVGHFPPSSQAIGIRRDDDVDPFGEADKALLGEARFSASHSGFRGYAQRGLRLLRGEAIARAVRQLRDVPPRFARRVAGFRGSKVSFVKVYANENLVVRTPIEVIGNTSAKLP
jgi:hypothetical protein